MNELSTFNSFLDDLFGADISSPVYRNRILSPKVDIKEENNAYTLEMELPGRCENDVNIELDHDNLTISSAEKNKKEEKTEKYILKERNTCSFSRRFILPSDVNQEGISASFKNGVLTVVLEKKAIEAPKKIAISA